MSRGSIDRSKVYSILLNRFFWTIHNFWFENSLHIDVYSANCKLMKLDRQLQILIDEAPQHGVPSLVMEKVVSPVLKAFASQLQHLEYYILQSRDRDWVVSTIAHLERPQQEKRVIYAFSTSESATNSQESFNLQMSSVSLPVTHLLFQLLALESIDSIIFIESGKVEKGIEIPRAKLQESLQKQLQQPKSSSNSNPKSIPSNLA
jgi:hypothetical protein